MSSTEKENNKYCCYCEYLQNGEDKKECNTASQEEYDTIDDTIKQYENIFDIKIKSFDCKSTYLQIGFLSTLLFIF